jgi:GNAT superfamily N-acetyltransferase
MQLVQKQYGNLNYDRTLYDKDRLQAGIAEGRYRFFLAVCEGEDIGIVCLKQSSLFTDTYEGCTLSVIPEFRRQGIAAMLMDSIREIFPKLQAPSIFYSILTTGTVEQIREYQNGFTPTGFALDRFLFDRDALNVKKEELPERRHHIYFVKPLKAYTAKLFIPPDVKPVVTEIYKNLNVSETDREVIPAPQMKAFYPENAYAEFFGCEDFDEIPDGFSINAYLDMTDRRCPDRYKKLLNNDWRFTGIKPLQKTAEYLIMHRGSTLNALDKTITLKEFDEIKEKIRGMGNV